MKVTENLLSAIADARDNETYTYGAPGLSAKHYAENDVWEISFCQDRMMTVISSEDEFYNTDEKIAKMIVNCWENEWDEDSAEGDVDE